MSHTVRNLPTGRTTITDHSTLDADGAATVHHFDVAADGTVTVGTDERLDLLLGVYPDAVAVEATSPPKEDQPPAPPEATPSRKTRSGRTSS